MGFTWVALAADTGTTLGTVGGVLAALGAAGLIVAIALRRSEPGLALGDGDAALSGGIASLTLGTVALFSATAPVFGWVLGGLAVLLAYRNSRTSEGRGWKAQSGYALGLVAIAVATIVFFTRVEF